jgi:hypothetical protein
MGLWDNVPTFNNPPKFDNVDDANAYIKSLVGKIAIGFNEISAVLNGGVDSRNTREIGGWKVNLTELVSKAGDVGMSTAHTAADDVRLWAGSTDKDTAPWRVYESGKMVATSALIESDSNYPKVVLDPNGDLIGAYTSATTSIVIHAFNGGTGAPYLEWTNGSLNVSIDLTSGVFTIGGNSDAELRFPSGDLDLKGRDNFLYADNFTHVPDWNQLKDDNSGNTLQDELDTKATVGNPTSSNGGGSFNGGIPPGTVLMVSGGGTVTWSGITIPNHSHTQT